MVREAEVRIVDGDPEAMEKVSAAFLEDGGPVHPVYYEPGVTGIVNTGMKQRDWFAGQVVAGLFANPNVRGSWDKIIPVAADVAYRVADAMLAERDK